MTQEEYKSALLHCWMIANIVEDLPLGEMLRAIDSADAIVPVVDPTLWIRKRDAMGEDKAIIEAVAGVQRAYAKLKAAHPELQTVVADMIDEANAIGRSAHD